VLVVVVLLPAPAALGRIEALPLAAAPVAPAALGRAEALLAAPTPAAEGLLLELVVEVEVPVVVVVGAAPRMSMNTTLSPLLATFMKVPAMAGIALDEPLVAEGEVDDAALVEELDEPPALEDEVNEPFHWFCVSSC